MLTIQKYAAIDIGSNAVRLLISNIIEEKGKPARFKISNFFLISGIKNKLKIIKI